MKETPTIIGLIVALLVLAVLFSLLERFAFSLPRKSLFRRERTVDLLWWFFTPIVSRTASSPTFHRWHHTSQDEGLDRNFAGLFPWIDALFGTLYMPRNRQPERFGIAGERVPSGLLGQLAYPFKRS